MNKNNIIIAGVPRAGKSTLSNTLSRRFGYQHISMDSIIAGIETVFPELDIKWWWSLSGKELEQMDTIYNASEKVALFIKAMLASEEYDEFEPGMVIDVLQLLPEHYAKYLHGMNCDIVYLLTSDVTPDERLAIQREYDTEKHYTFGYSDEKMFSHSTLVVEMSRFLKDECTKYGLPYYETARNRPKVFEWLIKRFSEMAAGVKTCCLLLLLVLSAGCTTSTNEGETQTMVDDVTEISDQSVALLPGDSDLPTGSEVAFDDFTDIQVSDLGDRLYSPVDESTWAKYPLYAMLEENDIFLYGGDDYGAGDSGMLLCLNGQFSYFDWPEITPRAILPQMMLHDFDDDGNEELAVLLYVGGGTGIALMDCHILNVVGSDVADGNHNADHALLSADVSAWMTAPLNANLSSDNGLFFSFDFAGESHIIESHDLDENGLFSEISYGDVVRFEFEGTRIVATIALGAIYENTAVPQFFGDIKAVVVFDGERLRLDEYTFASY